MKHFLLSSIILALAASDDAALAFQTPQTRVIGSPMHRSPSTPTTSIISPANILGKNAFTHQTNRILVDTTTTSSPTALFGIPKMFRWLTDQYPNILNRRLGSAQSIPPIDNFYLDMNGIIHPCTHGNNEEEITILDETEMFKKIFGYVDRLYKIVQPKKVLYLAVDGVS